jgi:hypothetical protein
MASQQVLFAGAPGQTLTAKLFSVGSQTEAYSTTSVAELPASSGLYSATFVESTAINGNYRLIGLNGSDGVCHYKVPFTGTDGETISGVEFTEAVSADSIADSVWDSLLASHNVAGSFGKAIRQMKEGLIVDESSVNDASATTSAFITNLTSAVDDFYNDDTLVFISGALTGQSRIIADYNGTTKAVTFDETLTLAPADTDEFILLAGHNLTLTQIENQIWNAATSNHQTAGTTGKAFTDAGGGSSSVVVYPIQSVTPQRTNETTLKAYLNETVSFTVLPVDADGDPVDTTGMTLAVVVEDRQTTDVETITDASITKTATSYTFSTSTSNTTLGQKRWSCRNTANANVISTGQYVVTYAPE